MADSASPSAPHRLRELREASDDSRVDLAQSLGLKSTVQIDRWEGQGQDIPIYHARAIAKRYGVSVGYLLGDGEPIEAA